MANEAAVLGRVVHRAMEVLTLRPTSERSPSVRAAAVAAAAREFAASRTQAASADEVVGRWLDAPQLAAWLDPAQCAWAGNEHSLAHGGDVLRIDRLVRLETAGGPAVWWVLDYKLEHRPQDRPEYRAQLGRYAEAIRAALAPEDPADVQAAFITGRGDFVPV